jgi:Flp pilus assembly protein TadD
MQLDYLNMQGYQYLLNGLSEEALNFFQQATEFAPANPVVLNNLGLVLGAMESN